MSDLSFKLMTAIFTIVDFIYPYIDRRVGKFGIREGMTVIDYGCGPGRYTARFSKLVGENGRVYAVDIHELAIDLVRRKIRRDNLRNVVPVLATRYDSGIADNTGDMICAIDMFFSVGEPTTFLKELRRILRQDGMLIIDDGHQSRAKTKKKLLSSECWRIAEETRDHLKCRPIKGKDNAP